MGMKQSVSEGARLIYEAARRVSAGAGLLFIVSRRRRAARQLNVIRVHEGRVCVFGDGVRGSELVHAQRC